MTSLREKIGQLCIFGFDGYVLPDLMKQMIRDWNLGGVIFFKRNIESKEQVKDLIKEVKSLQKKIPLFVSVDHEGGRVFRLPPPFTQVPTAREISNPSFILPLSSRGGGEGFASKSSYDWGVLMGQELKEVGFNLNYAPVLDVDSNPKNPIIGDRSFGNTPEGVIEHALELARGLRSEGVIPCGKHFPGHGDTAQDSHLELPIVNRDLESLEKVEFPPFEAAVKANIEMLMTAHVLYPSLDSENPATLSKSILTGLLREKMGYEGLIISDDFNMKAVSDEYGLGEAACLFLEAGGDIPLICRGEEAELQALEYLLQALETGRLKPEKLQISLNRILKLKEKML